MMVVDEFTEALLSLDATDGARVCVQHETVTAAWIKLGIEVVGRIRMTLV